MYGYEEYSNCSGEVIELDAAMLSLFKWNTMRIKRRRGHDKVKLPLPTTGGGCEST